MRNFFKAMSITFVLFFALSLAHSIFSDKEFINSAVIALILMLWIAELIKDFDR